MTPRLPLVATLMLSACAHQSLNVDALVKLERPAIFGRIEEGAGPVSTVFRDDSSFGPRLQRLDAQEGDRRLSAKLAHGTPEQASITRFEVADSLRAQTVALLPKVRPYSTILEPTRVASVLESFLVDEVPANEPDYARLVPMGADSVLEIVIEKYGMRAEKGQAGVFVIGFARLFKIDGPTLYSRKFFSDELKAGLPGADPFAVAKNPGLFRDRLKNVLTAIARQVAEDVSVPEAARASVAQEPKSVADPKNGDVSKPQTGERKTEPNSDPL